MKILKTVGLRQGIDHVLGFNKTNNFLSDIGEMRDGIVHIIDRCKNIIKLSSGLFVCLFSMRNSFL